jgi:hypothetical protein
MHKIRIIPDEDSRLHSCLSVYAQRKKHYDGCFLTHSKKKARADMDQAMAEIKREWDQEFPMFAQYDTASVMTSSAHDPYIEVKVPCLGP